jgi:hypothetical protein
MTPPTTPALPPLPEPPNRFAINITNTGQRLDYTAQDMRDYALAALRQAMGAAPESAKPVAWRWRSRDSSMRWGDWHYGDSQPEHVANRGVEVEALYAAPSNTDSVNSGLALTEGEPCPRGKQKPEPSCTNQHQCWEQCGELGHSAEHCVAAPPDLSARLDAKLGIVRRPSPSAPREGPAGGCAMTEFHAFNGEEMPDPLERLRYFCSLAMKPQDWADVGPFFDAVRAGSSTAVSGALPSSQPKDGEQL